MLPDAGSDVVVDGALQGEGAALRHAPVPAAGRHRGNLKDIAIHCNKSGENNNKGL